MFGENLSFLSSSSFHIEILQLICLSNQNLPGSPH